MCNRLSVFFQKYIMARVVFSLCLYSEDCFDRNMILFNSMFVSMNVQLELIVCEDLWTLQMFFVYIKACVCVCVSTFA